MKGNSMFRKSSETQIRDLQLDDFITSLQLTSIGGYTPTNNQHSLFEVQKQALEDELKAEVSLRSNQKK
jgi:hypothetical protein